jgi:magnesium-transporting ATPase (P-type)
MEMEELKNLAIGITGGLVVLVISKLYRTYRKKSIREDIELLEYEKNHLSEMKRSSVEMNRTSFRAIFSVLMFIGFANLIPYINFFAGSVISPKISGLWGIVLWIIVIALSISFWQRYDNLKNFKKATAKMNDKLEKLRSKYENS